MARAFISCGQRENERGIASAVAQVLNAAGITPYVATTAQSIQDVNSSIIAQLRRSDYYVFIDFRREPIAEATELEYCRGSLFSHQELAIAYELGFEHALFLREVGVCREGMSAFITATAITFENREHLPQLVSAEIARRGWNASYSRNLEATAIEWSSAEMIISYREIIGRFLYGEIANRRPDTGAIGTVVRLAFITDPSGIRAASPIRSHLKVTGHENSFEQTIWPLSSGRVDLLCLGIHHPSVFLNSALDIPTPPIISASGDYQLEFEVFAQGFPVTTFAIALHVTDDLPSTTAKLLRL